VSLATKQVLRVRRAAEVSGAFLRLGFQDSIAYPLAFAMSHLGGLLPAFIYFFVAKLVDRSGPNVGGDYYTFVIIGLVGVELLNAGLRSFSTEIDRALRLGWFEMILVEPVRWSLLPFAMSQWPAMQSIVRSTLILAVASALGASYASSGLAAAALTLLLGLAAGLAVGTLSASLKVLAKSGDPILFVYSLAAQVFSGVYFPVEFLPTWLRPLSFLVPHTYVIAAFRRSLMPGGGQLPGLELSGALLALLAFNVLVFPLALWLYGRAMEYGRKLGVLSGY
jgi:ABC-2 type transport system permease protein